MMEIDYSSSTDRQIFDSLIFYLLLGAIPTLLGITLVNIFVGPAELTDIPEGYEPEPWEYYKHPISRAMVKYLLPDPQMCYESHVGAYREITEQKRLIAEENWFKESQRTHGDYRGWYFIPTSPVGVNRGAQELELDKEIGELFPR